MSAVVTQADREAAADFCKWTEPLTSEAIRRGQCDKQKFVQAFAAHREAHTAGLDWQHIETAPKDGLILGYIPNRVEGGRPYQAVIWWDDQFRSEGWDEEADDVDYFGAWSAGRVGSFSYEEYAEELPTHWRPLPAPPAPDAAK